MEKKQTAIALTNPKYPHNVGSAVRAASCWGFDKLIWTGHRVPHPDEWKDSEEFKQYRIPREERMKGYKDVELIRTDRFKDIIAAGGYTPVAIEVLENSENLFEFEHPENPMYIFGPEDGSLDRKVLIHCHRFVRIPTQHCLNLACAINVVLAHRAHQIFQKTGQFLNLKEERGYVK